MSVAQWCLTLCNPMDVSPPGSSVPVISQARILKWVAFSPPGDLPDPGIEPRSPAYPALQVNSLLLSYWGSPSLAIINCLYNTIITATIYQAPLCFKGFFDFQSTCSIYTEKNVEIINLHLQIWLFLLLDLSICPSFILRFSYQVHIYLGLVCLLDEFTLLSLGNAPVCFW